MLQNYGSNATDTIFVLAHGKRDVRGAHAVMHLLGTALIHCNTMHYLINKVTNL